MTAAIVCRELRKRYPARPNPVEAVNGLDLQVERGECFGLLIEAVEVLEGLLDATSGDVEILGQRWGQGDDRALRQRIGVSLQETKLTEKLNVIETIRLFRSFYDRGLDPQAVLDMVALDEKRFAWVGKLSGGQKQRLAIATALVGNPELLFLDEPTTGLDPQSRRQLWEVLRDLRQQGRTILLTTHYMDEAERLCDRVAIVDHGKVIALGTPAELIARIGGEHFIEFRLEEDPHTGVAGPLADNDLTHLPSAVSLRREEDAYVLAVTAIHLTLPALLDLVQTRGFKLGRLTTRHASLEDVFVTLTGRRLREGD